MPNEKDDRSLQTKSSCISSSFILIIYPEQLPYKTRKGKNFHIMKVDSWGCVFPRRYEFVEFVRGGLGLNMWDVPESELLQLLGGDIYNMAGWWQLKYLLGIFIPKFGGNGLQF